MAYKAYNYFTRRDIEISKLGLAVGSVKPDFVKDEISHFKDESIAIFFENFDSMKNINPYENKFSFSVKLGELYHYIADFFTRAHNDSYFIERSVKHILYEWRLNRAAHKLEDDFFENSFENGFIYDMSLEKFIENEHQKFLKNKQSFENDLNSAFKVCILMTNKLIYEMELASSFAVPKAFNVERKLVLENA
ncbi:zinc dependent phospholipase C family protein [Halanaerobium sp. DL-01]|uniref:zinc dependent phospholipase C family protein n=1 Tax=Halanaerobium sp. DL-01 TaxID=1653064 RepID=UPI000DF39834|nr:zinc dependent phospholipase C family protein [Halanaerobium sp. DL-01]